MKIQLSNKVKKRLSGLTALTLSAAILLSGTFAWQSISQTATNKASGVANPGGRLHDYFDGQNKDVFVENFTDPNDNGVPIFARIRLDEYMEIGPDAGKKIDQTDRNVTVIGKTDAKINDSKTWITHKPGHLPGGEIGNTHTPMHEYWEWEMGGKGVYMPTFNMDKDNKDSDINGTYEGPDGVAGEKDGVDDRYQDYTKYEVGNIKEAVESYANSQTSGGNKTHTAKETLDGKVITMEEWLAKDEADRIGPMWVYDNDGWAYWAEPIQPGTATGLLLNGIKPVRQPDQEWYYAINVIGQFATAGDWGKKEDNSGFFADGITDDALNLLNKVADRLPQVVHMLVKNGFKQYVAVGDTLPLEVTADVKNPTGTEADTYVTWTCDPDVGTALLGNKFTPTEEMVGKTYRMTATSVLTPTITTYVDVVVMPKLAAGGQGVVEGALDKKKYINFGDNTYKEISDDGTIGDWMCAGLDQVIGNYDDRAGVKVTDITTPYGTKFLGPIKTANGEYYQAMGKDGLLGTADDIKVVSTTQFPDALTDILADRIEVTIPEEITNDNDRVKPGKQYRLSAKVKNGDQDSVIQNIQWSLAEGCVQDNTTKIGQDGLLYIGANEPLNNVLTLNVQTENLNGEPLLQSFTFTVREWEVSDLRSAPVGTTTTVKIDGKDFYLLAKNGNNALLWAKDAWGETTWDENIRNIKYEGSSLQTYTNNLINDKTNLQQMVVPTTIYTRELGTQGQSVIYLDSFETHKDQKMFNLSQADLYGNVYEVGGSTEPIKNTITPKARDFTYAGKALIDIKTDNGQKILYSGNDKNIVLRSIGLYHHDWTTDRYKLSINSKSDNYKNSPYPEGSNKVSVRPALWIDMTKAP